MKWSARHSRVWVATLVVLALGAAAFGILGKRELNQQAGATRPAVGAMSIHGELRPAVPRSPAPVATAQAGAGDAGPGIASAMRTAQDVAPVTFPRRSPRARSEAGVQPRDGSSTPSPTPLGSGFVPPPLPNPGF